MTVAGTILAQPPSRLYTAAGHGDKKTIQGPGWSWSSGSGIGQYTGTLHRTPYQPYSTSRSRLFNTFNVLIIIYWIALVKNFVSCSVVIYGTALRTKWNWSQSVISRIGTIRYFFKVLHGFEFRYWKKFLALMAYLRFGAPWSYRGGGQSRQLWVPTIFAASPYFMNKAKKK